MKNNKIVEKDWCQQRKSKKKQTVKKSNKKPVVKKLKIKKQVKQNKDEPNTIDLFTQKRLGKKSFGCQQLNKIYLVYCFYTKNINR